MKPRLLVNVIPLTIINTGISRYLRSLYDQMESHYSDILEIGYFDGVKVRKRPPSVSKNSSFWSRLSGLFWRLPPYIALAVRLIVHARREMVFRRVARDFDLYHEASFFPFKATRHLKTIFTIHDLSLLYLPQYHPKERVLYNKLFFWKRSKLANHVLCVSEFTKKEVIRLLDIKSQDVTVTHLAHDPSIFSPKTNAKAAEAIKRFALPNKYFLFVGSGDPRKNLKIIPQAIELAGLDIPLVVAGWVGWSKKYKQIENIRFLGYVSDEDLACLYSHSLAMVYPSFYEGFGLPVLEAMACGCPVVTTRAASLPEIGGDAALYLDNPNDVSELATILTNLAAGHVHREEIVRKSLEQALHFSWERTAVNTFNVFKNYFL